MTDRPVTGAVGEDFQPQYVHCTGGMFVLLRGQQNHVSKKQRWYSQVRNARYLHLIKFKSLESWS